MVTLLGGPCTSYRLRVTSYGLGFTLIELLIAMALMIVLIGAAAPLYSNLQTSSQLNESAVTVASTLRLARTRSVARQNNSSYGVYIEANAGGADRLILFAGISYAARNPAYDRITTFDSALSVTPMLSGGVTEIVFSRATGVPSATGTIGISHATTGSRSVSINALGAVDYD
ncbi:hypothetical protein HY623_01415 [Candidatus Uhrbacteria bacterium]|nr:hypothetical protein [Candidatus Uhrbacteria bacterium]